MTEHEEVWNMILRVETPTYEQLFLGFVSAIRELHASYMTRLDVIQESDE